MLRAVFAVLFMLEMVSCWVVAFPCCLLAAALLYPFASRPTRILVVGKIWRLHAVILVRVLMAPLWTLRVVSSPEAKAPGKTIFMMNHASNCDPFFAASALWPWEAKWIAKSSLMMVPFGGWCMWLAGDIPVHFTKDKEGWGTKKGSVATMMAECASLLQGSMPIAVFPEGVRTKDPSGPLQAFKLGFFDLAIKEQANIVPVVLTNTHRAWPRGDWRVGRATVYAVIGAPIDVAPFGTDVEKLVKHVYDTMTTMKAGAPLGIVAPRAEKKTA